MINIKCDECEKKYNTYPCKLKINKFNFCSKKCKYKSNKVKKSIGVKNSIAMKKNWNNKKYRENQIKSFQNKEVSLETRKKLSILAKQRVQNGTFNLKPKRGKDHPWYGRKHTPEAIEKNRIAHTGIKQSESTIKKRIKSGKEHHSWKGGITPKNKKIRNSKKYKDWRLSVFERDNYTCIICKSKSGSGKTVVLNADHIKPFSLYPKLRFNLNNGRTLCVPCHKKTDTFAGKIRRLQ